MRSYAWIAALPLLALTACGGASGPQTAGSIAPPATGGTGTGGTGGGIGGGTGTGTGTGTSTPTPTPTQFLDVASTTNFDAVGSFQSLTVAETGKAYDPTQPGSGEGGKIYSGNASTTRAPSGTINYSPRDGIFTINIADDKADTTIAVRFQDPGHRSEENGWGLPTGLTDFNYLEARGSTSRAATATDLGRADQITFFYQRPGSQTNYVSLAGWVRNAYDRTADPQVFKTLTQSKFERGAFVFGTPTQRAQVPTTGKGTYTGGLLATMIANPDTVTPGKPNYFQWITGTSSMEFDFASSSFTMALAGVAQAVDYNGPRDAGSTLVEGGTSFVAEGKGVVSLVSSGGFTGEFTKVCFACTATDPAAAAIIVKDQRVNPGNSTAGANSIDGTFFGPNAVNVGGNFRIVGGVPDQRVDIMGAFTGAKK